MKSVSSTAGRLVRIALDLRAAVAPLRFGPPVYRIYNPLEYAWKAHREYLTRYGSGRKEIVLVGMNPGPWGMAQTGVPFGHVGMVRDWMGIEVEVGRPARPHPKRPVDGFACRRNEVSGARLWGWARDQYGPASTFFRRLFVTNYCPLAFFEAAGRNRTPDRLPAAERERLFRVCDRALVRLVDCLQPRVVLGIGRFAERRARAALGEEGPRIGVVLHPSPASPAANRGWAAAMTAAMKQWER